MRKLFDRFTAWAVIFIAVFYLSNVARPVGASQSIQPAEGALSPIDGPAMHVAQWGGGKKKRRGEFGGRKGKMGGDGAAAEPEGDGPDAEVRNAFMALGATTEAMDARGFFTTGLRPVYPEGLDCQTANSFFADDTRGNGSQRSQRFYNGRHGGMDIPAKGIDIIAMADGEVIAKKIGKNIGGIGVVVRHSPEDTGLGVWTFTEYKHLKEPSPLALNSRVRAGDVVGVAWNTGTTTGRAYGPAGHYHLHLSTWYNATGEFKNTRNMLLPTDGYWTDPLAMLRGMPIESSAVKNLPDAEKNIRFAYKTADGAIHPERAKVIWPFVCR